MNTLVSSILPVRKILSTGVEINSYTRDPLSTLALTQIGCQIHAKKSLFSNKYSITQADLFV
ncbi:MAG TPA: hypothetical protein HA306_08420 [Methanosarcina sp.]|nr:hypothetical protein [Methanosarcina sp.]